MKDIVAKPPNEFAFQSHFDENGALFFLGSFGKRRLWQNPHLLGQIQAFSSSIGSGKPEDVVGRTMVNCRTGNEPFSYFGVDLGEGRETLLGEVDGLVRVELVVLDFNVCLCLFETVVVREYLRLDPGNGLFGRREVASCSAGFDLGLRELEGGEE